MDEIRNSHTARRAMQILLQQLPDTGAVDLEIAAGGPLNETWARLAGDLANADAADFEAITRKITADRDHLVALREQTGAQHSGATPPNDATAIAGYDRALALLDLVTDWRSRVSGMQESAVGSEPYRPAVLD